MTAEAAEVAEAEMVEVYAEVEAIGVAFEVATGAQSIQNIDASSKQSKMEATPMRTATKLSKIRQSCTGLTPARNVQAALSPKSTCPATRISFGPAGLTNANMRGRASRR